MKSSPLFASLSTSIILILVLLTFPIDADQKVLRIYGTTPYVDLITNSGSEFMKNHPDIRVEILQKRSEEGFQAILSNQAEIVFAVREPNSVERRLAERKGMKWSGELIARQDMKAITHCGISLDELTLMQLRKIYTGEYKNWRDLGGADVSILPHSMSYPQDDIAVWFFDSVLSRAEFASGIIWVQTPDFLVEHVGVHPGAIAYLSELQLIDVQKQAPLPKVRVLDIRADTESPSLNPSPKVSSKNESPLNIPLYLYWNENNPDKRIRQFVQFCNQSFTRTGEKVSPEQSSFEVTPFSSKGMLRE